MKKLAFSRSIFSTWLRRYWVAGALMALVFIFIAVGLHTTYSAVALSNAFSSEAEVLTDILLFIADVGTSFGIHIIIAIFAIIISMLSFGYLKNIRAATMIHSLPFSRESLFLSASGAGLCLLFAPILFAVILFSIVQGIHGFFQPGPMLLFLAVSLVSALFYFFVSAFIGMLTGNTITQGLLTLLFLFLPWILEGVISSWCSRYLFGWDTSYSPGAGAALNPFYQMFEYLDGLANYYGGYSDAFPILTPILMLVIGLAFAVLAVLLYRVRRVEAAGDIIAMRGVRPFFRYILALFFALLFSAIFRTAFWNMSTLAVDIFFGIVGGFVGFFIAEMFIRRTAKVFKHFMGGVIFAVAYTVILLCIAMDAGGYSRAQLSTAGITDICIPRISANTRAAMGGKPIYSVYETPDIELPPTAKNDEPLPASYAPEILAADHTVFKGEDMEDAVALQNFIAQNTGALRQTSAAFDYYDYYGYDLYNNSKAQYYSVEVVAKTTSGRVFRRVYRFTLDEGQLPELLALYNKLDFLTRAGNWQNVLDTIDRAKSLSVYDHLGYDTYNGLGDSTSEAFNSTLTPASWGELLAAYQKDLDAARANPPEAETLAANTVVTLEPVYGDLYWGSASMEVPYSFENTIHWLLDNRFIDAKALELYAAAYDTQSTTDEPIYGYDDFEDFVMGEDNGATHPFYEE